MRTIIPRLSLVFFLLSALLPFVWGPARADECLLRSNAYEIDAIVLAEIEDAREGEYEEGFNKPVMRPMTVATLKILSVLRSKTSCGFRVGERIDAVSLGVARRTDKGLQILNLADSDPNRIMIPGQTILAEISVAHSRPPRRGLEGNPILTFVAYVEAPADPERIDVSNLSLRSPDLSDLSEKCRTAPRGEEGRFDPKALGIDLRFTHFQGYGLCSPDSLPGQLVRRFDERAERSRER